ncbi:uncharacterized protein LOC119076591 isoform X2 [Bradysia coprophila]|uniref:uncharacterized protein LOC119076591 isoform X2 n=1 Tax=Bradysia coprophila TaxID=38358 RepID=UPI00187D7063|nr:uncharacterized protein LOC119076591 isoform X2 [Bradysia coprophila]
MNFAGAKENIQPLLAGRNVEQLEVALNAESQHECQEELLEQRKQFELAIANYSGEDPLELWFDYIGWVEQSYPKSGKAAALDDLLKKSLSKFEKDSRYAQDSRFIRLFIKYIDSKDNPHLYYTKLYNSGVGTMVADLYIAWAHYFDVLDEFDQAKAVYQKGLDARAAPIDHLKQVYERFQFSVGQRVIRKEEYRQEFLSTMEAQRNAFTSLRSLKRSKVGSIRTGSAVKSLEPGRVRQNQSLSSSSSSNVPLKVYDGASVTTSKPLPQPYRSVVEEIENSMVENKIEPGPWSKASSRKSVFHNVHGNSALKFAILEDDLEQPPIKLAPLPPDNGNLAINLPKNFVRKNDPQTPFELAAYVEEVVDLHTIPAYPKFYLQPNAKICFQPEELRHYKRLKAKNISNEFTEHRDIYWGVGSTLPARFLPNFPRQNKPQTEMETEWPDISLIPCDQVFVCNLRAMYPKDSKLEVPFEQNIIANRESKKNNQNNAGEMDETVCVRGRQSFGVQHTRRSIVSGGRKSIMPVASDRDVSIRRFPSTDDSSSDMDLTTDDIDEVINRKEKVSANALIATVDEFLKPAPKPQTALPNRDGEFKKPLEPPKTTQWSVFTDDEPSTMQTPEQMATKTVQSPAIFSSKSSGSGADKSSKETFAVPQVPVARTAAEKRTTESVTMKHTDIPTASTSSVQASYPIGPQTGAVRKSILRKSTISEHAIESSSIGSSNDNADKLPPPDLDYSLCTQAFNVNLAEQMASTPVAIRRKEPLAEQIRSSHDVQPTHPLKLSTIMETTEGSASAASTKSSTQFSSPEDEDLSKRSNVTNRTKLAGTTVCPDDEATNYSKSEPNHELSNNGAGLTNYSCNVEHTMPAIQLSLLPGDYLLPNTAPSVQFKSEVATVAKEEPTKNYPFPIFEDTQTTTTIAANVSSEPNAARNSGHSGDGQFNETSMWIKDEPKSFTLNNISAAEESFALPMVVPRDSFAPLLGTTVSETSNNFAEFAHQSKATAEESFTLPNRQRKSMAPLVGTTVGETSNKFAEFAHQSKAGAQADISTAEESFDLPNRQRKSMAPLVGTTVSETSNNFAEFAHQSKAGAQIDSSTAGESFALANESHTNTLHQIKDELQTDTSTTEQSFALPNAQQTVPEMSGLNGTFELDSSDSEEEIIEVPDDTLMEDVPKIVDVQSLANRNNFTANRFETSTRLSISITEEEMAVHMNLKNANGDAEMCDQSIYFKQNSVLVQPPWIENEAKLDSTDRNAYQHEEVNLEESRIVIDTKLAEVLVDPFNEVLRGAILADIQFMEFLKKNAACDLISTVPTVAVKRSITFKDTHFDVLKSIGHGAYGRVYNVKCQKDGSTYAVKKEMPANLWEYYILREVHSRVVGNLSGYMQIDMAIIANDGSLLFSQYSQYGTLLDVCNRVFTSINSNINESIVFILAYQMLDLVDRLHKAGILHLDLKPDNFLVMKPMSTDHRDLFIQLIDFGNAVDLQQYPPGQQFNAALETKHFVCLEMLEHRPWIFQPDLYCLAATIHSVLFGRYLEVKKLKQNYCADVKIPRYFHAVWRRFFQELIHIPGGTSPNLKILMGCFDKVIVEDRDLKQKIARFNQFIV